MGLSLSSDRQEEETPAAVAPRTSRRPNCSVMNHIFDFGFAFSLVFLASRNLRSRSQLETPITIDLNTEGGRDSASCTICQEEFAPGEKVCVLPRCKHMFHEDCLRDWIMSKGTCPLCRDRVIDPRVVGWRGGLLGRS